MTTRPHLRDAIEGAVVAILAFTTCGILLAFVIGLIRHVAGVAS